MMLFPAPSTRESAPPLGGLLFATGRLHTEPLPFAQAKAYVAAHHRHNEPPQGHVFSVGCYFDGVLVGVAIVGRPVARALDKGHTLEVTRVCTQGQYGELNICSKLYAACQQRARLRGCRRLITYTLQSERASSVRGANFVLASAQAGGARWTGKRAAGRKSGATAQELKCRWEIELAPVAAAAPVRDAYQPMVSRPNKAGAEFDCLIYPGRAYAHQPGLPVPPLPVAELAGVSSHPTEEQFRDLHELAWLADTAGYQLLLARHNPRLPFYLTTSRHGGGGHRRSIQWGDTHLSGGDRLRVYLSAEISRKTPPGSRPGTGTFRTGAGGA